MQFDDIKLRNVKELLVRNRGEIPWPWLDDAYQAGRKVTQKEANKFLVGSMLDRQMDWRQVWGNARKLTEECLGDPDDLWQVIFDMPLDRWKNLWEIHKFHRFWNIGCNNVRQNAETLLQLYDGDARNIWEGCDNSEIKRRLERLSGVGDAISNMILGALWDRLQIPHNNGKPLEVKPDIRVRRVVGRVFLSEECRERESVQIARAMYPDNPWVLDRPLFWLGESHCHSVNPECHTCYLAPYCEYNACRVDK